jgi:peptidyl-prolyl cis-trans isomerase SurA
MAQMTSSAFAARRRPSTALFLTLAATVAVGACNRGQGGQAAAKPSAAPVPADTWATVDGREIKRDEVEKAFRRTAPPEQQASEEEVMTAKLGLLNDLITQDLLLAKARELKVELPEAELDKAYADAKQGITDEQFNQQLTARSLTAADMREQLRRDLLTQKLLEREVIAKATVNDQEITDFFNANKASFNRPEDAYHIAQIAITPVQEPQVANRTGSDAKSAQEAQAKAQMLMERLKQGAPFAELAADFSEDPQSAPRGGDLGFVPLSALRQAPPALQNAVLQSQPGSVRVVSQGGAHTLVLFVAKDTAGQKDLSMPEVKSAIGNNLKQRKELLLRAAYLSAIRNDAVVVNHVAKRLVEGGGKAPGTLAPAAPGK